MAFGKGDPAAGATEPVKAATPPFLTSVTRSAADRADRVRPEVIDIAARVSKLPPALLDSYLFTKKDLHRDPTW